ncbi:MAG: hypothetical protein JW881_17675 [Spirochaetales bacterium]|nr:hypothetical protein [Spirochaetales bacterium]
MCESELKVFGALIMGYAQACLNLNIIAGRKVSEFLGDIQPTEWYPLSQWTELEKIVVQSYRNADAILERVGMEMMLAWYNFGPGKDIIVKGIDFLHFQTSSEGYASVVKGPAEKVGSFSLKSVDEKEGKAVVQTTTPFHRKMECGVLIGGMKAPGDIDYIDVVNEGDSDTLEIEFH